MEPTKHRALYALFLVTFPGYFVYHYLVTVQVLPPFLAGYSTPVGVLSLPLLLLIHAQARSDAPHGPRHVIELSLWVFLAYYAVVTFWVLSTRNTLASADAHPTVIAQFVALFLLARYAPVQFKDTRLLTLLIFIMSLMVVHNASNGGLLDATIAVTFGITNSLISYQGYAFAYFVCLAYLIPLLQDQPWWRIGLYAVACAALFLNGARSEFAVAFVAFGALEFLRAHSKLRALQGVAVAVLMLIGTYLVFEETFQDYRIITIFTDFDEDISVQDRRRMLADGMATIQTHPVIGRMGSYPAGEYIHGILSAWVDLGAAGFVLFMGLTLLPVAHLLIHRKELASSTLVQQAFLFTASSLMLSITAKPFTQYLLPVALGLCARHEAAHLASRRPGSLQRSVKAAS